MTGYSQVIHGLDIARVFMGKDNQVIHRQDIVRQDIVRARELMVKIQPEYSWQDTAKLFHGQNTAKFSWTGYGHSYRSQQEHSWTGYSLELTDRSQQ